MRLCDDVFGHDAAESERESIESRRLSIEDVVRMEAAARTIQNAFIRRGAARKCSQFSYDYDEEYMEYDYFEGESTDYDYESIEESATNAGGTVKMHNHMPSSQPSTRLRHHSVLRRINEQGDDYDEEIEVEWRKPSWRFAKRFEASNRPHRPGKQMKKYDWTSVTLGRHCYAGGCGEQLDLWNEGRTSEFSQFGSGITNYFKVRCCVVL